MSACPHTDNPDKCTCGPGCGCSSWIGDPPFTSEWSEHMRSLLGKQVRVTIDRDKPVIVKGTLLCFNEGGEVVVREDDGFVTWSWPALEAEEQ